MYYSCRVTKVSANWRLLISQQHSLCLILVFFLAQEIACKSVARIAFQALISFYGSEQQVAFEGETWFSAIDIDRQGIARVQSTLKHVVVTVQVVLCSTAPPMICKKLRLICLQTVLWIQPFQILLLYTAWVQLLLPVIKATVECSFSDKRQVKTRLRSHVGKNTLDQAMPVCIEDPSTCTEWQRVGQNNCDPFKNMKPIGDITCK